MRNEGSIDYIVESTHNLDIPPLKRLSKAQKRKERRAEKAQKSITIYEEKPLVPRNETQADFIDALKNSDQVFAVGPAGTGKTYIAAHHAMHSLITGKTEGIVVARPTVTKPKHRQGFLPGNEKEKIEPWLVPIISAFKDVVAAHVVDKMTRDGRIDYLSFETMRGRSLNRCIVILDEAQNCDYGDLRLFLTRIGEDSQVIVCGDPDPWQCDIGDASGLNDVLEMIEEFDLSAEIIEFDEDDVVRSGIAKEWVKAFTRYDKTV